MIFIIESLVVCAVFTVVVTSSVNKNVLDWISDYPPAIQKRAKELGLIAADKKFMTGKELTRKVLGTVVIIVLSVFMMVYINGAETFMQGFLWSYGLYNVVAWYDAIVIDCLWFAHSKKVILPGTEDMIDSYHDYAFHFKMSFIGILIGLPVCMIIGLGVMILA